jgi:hypothetical protein
MCVTPHVASKVKHSALDGRTTRQAAYATSQRKRKLVEEAFGKTIAAWPADAPALPACASPHLSMAAYDHPPPRPLGAAA